MNLAEIKLLQVELSSRCNAWCPGCPRNNQGYGLRPGLVPQDLDIERLKNAVLKLPNLTRVQLCGRFGDPLMHKNFKQVISWLVEQEKEISIHTNGSLRNVKWWSELGSTLKDCVHNVWFAIDGLENVHEIYRQGTNFNKIIENASAFIDSGGHATWQFIPFKHNEHQISDCINLASKLGFNNFEIIAGVRNTYQAYNYVTSEPYQLEEWSRTAELNCRHNTDKTLEIKNCVHAMAPSLYITATGKYTMCCHFDSIFPEYDAIMFDNIEDTQDIDITHEISTQPRPLCVKACSGLNIERKTMPLINRERPN